MKDIAAETGVSKSTISRYFNNGSVKKNTASKIKKACDKYNYYPNTYAQELSRGRNGSSEYKRGVQDGKTCMKNEILKQAVNIGLSEKQISEISKIDTETFPKKR